MGEILIGTSGYYYDDWKGPFYPDNMAKKDYLNYYSRYFHTLELNYTYYRLPEAKQSGTMIARAGTDMTFVVKAHKEMTHNITENSISAVLPLLLNGITPFIDSDCLGSILLQFPQSFHYTNKNRIYLKQLIQELLPAPLSVEFRNKDWIKESVYNSLSELNAGFVCVDEPELPNLIPKLNIITSETGYIRFHGRNRENWYGTDSIVVIVSDSTLSDTSFFHLDVTPVNDYPVWTLPPDTSMHFKDSLVIYLVDYVFDVDDPDSNLSFNMTTGFIPEDFSLSITLTDDNILKIKPYKN